MVYTWYNRVCTSFQIALIFDFINHSQKPKKREFYTKASLTIVVTFHVNLIICQKLYSLCLYDQEIKSKM
jgi:hypothetical protein